MDVGGNGPAAYAKVLRLEELSVSAVEDLQSPKWLERERDREIWKRRPEEVGHALDDFGLTWHCGHHSFCILEVLGFPPNSSSSHTGSPSPSKGLTQ